MPEHRRSRTDPRRRSPQRALSGDRHGRADSEATTCVWKNWRSRPAVQHRGGTSDPLRSGASPNTFSPTAALSTVPVLRSLNPKTQKIKGFIFLVLPNQPNGGLDKLFHRIDGPGVARCLRLARSSHGAWSCCSPVRPLRSVMANVRLRRSGRSRRTPLGEPGLQGVVPLSLSRRRRGGIQHPQHLEGRAPSRRASSGWSAGREGFGNSSP